MDIELMFDKMYNYINSDLSVYVIRSEYKDKFNKSLDLIKNHVNILDNDSTIDTYDPKVVEECVAYLKEIVVQNEINEIFSMFLHDYLFVSYNWNNNVYRNKNLDDSIKFLYRCVDDHLTLKELVDISNNMSNRLSEFKKWLPPAFKLSEHYYSLFKED